MMRMWSFLSRKLTPVVLCVGLVALIFAFYVTGRLPDYAINTLETNTIQSTRKPEHGVNNLETSTIKTTRKPEHGVNNLETSTIKTTRKPEHGVNNLETSTRKPLSSDYCNDSLVLPQSENIKRVLSFQLPENEAYIQDLFPSSMSLDIPDTPLFITGFSTNHFQEGRALIDNFNKVIKVKYPHFRLHVYDIGLQTNEISQVKLECNCTVERFKLETFPDHNRILKGYGWKPLIIQYTAKQYRFVIWMDASIRFTTPDIDSLLQKIRSNGIVVGHGTGSIADRTLKRTFDILHEQPCVFKNIPEIEANFIAIYVTDYVKDYIMKPWVRCALFRGCLVSREDVLAVITCNGQGQFHGCHRFDQSILGIILHRLNHANISDNILMHNTFYKVCRDCTL